MALLGIPSIEALRRSHNEWVEEALARAERVREGKWTESVAVGSRDFVETMKAKLGIRGRAAESPERMANPASANPRLLTVMILMAKSGF